jgi:hypothetical protein
LRKRRVFPLRAGRLFGARLGGYAVGETTLAHAALTALRPGMLCLADAGVVHPPDVAQRSDHRPPRAAAGAVGARISTTSADATRRWRQGHGGVNRPGFAGNCNQDAGAGR